MKKTIVTYEVKVTILHSTKTATRQMISDTKKDLLAAATVGSEPCNSVRKIRVLKVKRPKS